MKRILLLGLTVGVSFAFATVSATARDLDVDMRIPPCTTGLII